MFGFFGMDGGGSQGPPPDPARDPRSDHLSSDYLAVLSDPSNVHRFLFPHPPNMSNDYDTPSPTSAPPPKIHARPSTSRVIIPTPQAPSPNTAAAASPTGQSPAGGGGPLSSSYVVPPRPKPGRKPATDEPASKRKAQNRESQRAFRARKAAKLTEMASQVEEYQQKHRDEMNRMIAEVHQLQAQLKERDAQLDELRETLQGINSDRDYWKERCNSAESGRQMSDQRLNVFPALNPYGDQHSAFFPRRDSPARHNSFGSSNNSPKTDGVCGTCKPEDMCQCMTALAGIPLMNPFIGSGPRIQPPQTNASPTRVNFQPVDPFAEREIDFTAQFTSKRSRTDQRPSSSIMAHGNDDANCGFCTDPSNCLCRDQSMTFAGNDDVKPQTKLPGSCDDCQRNPKQRAWCQRIAQLKNDEFMPAPSRNSSIGSALETMEPHIPDASAQYNSKMSIGCSATFKLLDGRVPMEQDKMDWIGNLKQVPPTIRRDTMVHNPREYSALEIDTAGIIATLGNTMKPLQSRLEDGDNADIVHMAQQIQRGTRSPRTGSV